MKAENGSATASTAALAADEIHLRTADVGRTFGSAKAGAEAPAYAILKRAFR
jgi:hypothetical protein